MYVLTLKLMFICLVHMVVALYRSCNFSRHICSGLFIWTPIYVYSLCSSQITVNFFTFAYNSFLPFVLSFCRNNTYISVCKVPENFDCDCMWQMSKSVLQFILSNFLLHLVHLSMELFVYLKLVSLCNARNLPVRAVKQIFDSIITSVHAVYQKTGI